MHIHGSVFISSCLASICLGIYQPEKANLETLQLVQVIHRHGDKNPEQLYPNDPYNQESYWDGGWGQLTELGVNQTYALGEFLRNRYGNFLSDRYHYSEMFAISSDSERSIRSALSNLAGFYATNEHRSLYPSVPPIRTFTLSQDNCLASVASCPKFDAAHEDYLHNSEFAKAIYEENGELFKYITLHSGWNITSLGSKIGYFYDGLVVEEKNHYPLPNWTLPIFNSQLNNLTAISLGVKTHNTFFQRMETGPLLKIIRNNLQVKAGREDPKKFSEPIPFPQMYKATRKMLIFSGHDINIVGLMNTLGVYEFIRPPFASAILIELHKNSSDYYLKFLFRNETGRDPYLLPVRTNSGEDETSSVKLDNFLSKIEPVIPEDWEQECQTAQMQPINFGTTMDPGLLQFFLGTFFGVFVVVLIALALLNHKRSHHAAATDLDFNSRKEYTPFLR